MSENLQNLGIYFDEVDKVRILQPDTSKLSNDLREECSLYMEKFDEFQKNSDNMLNLTEKLAKHVERQKMKAIGARNRLQSMAKEKEMRRQQLQALIDEKTMELERLKVQINSLQKTEMEQNEVIIRLTQTL